MPKKLLKTYHGVPKSPVDSNTVFYASFDGTTVAEVGGSPIVTDGGTPSYLSSVTGLGLNIKDKRLDYPLFFNSSKLTLEFFISRREEWTSNYKIYPLYIYDTSDTSVIHFDNMGNSIRLIYKGVAVKSWTIPNDGTQHHIRVVFDDDVLNYKTYLDGVQTSSTNYSPSTLNSLSKIVIAKNSNTYNSIVSDVHISNIDRGSYFPTLPKDFIDGKAKIAMAFNPQRQTYSDAFTSETITDIAKIGNNSPELTVSRTSGSWTSGDTIKVKGLGGEIITGVIDTDTALAKVTQTSSGSVSTINLDDVSKFIVGDTFRIYSVPAVWTSTEKTITAIDSTNKTITWSGGTETFTNTDFYILESTTSSSSPVVKFMNGTTPTTVTGTWSNLGTNEATFTLGTNASLVAQDIEIQYSLNEIAGQGGISEVLTSTLGGEVNGKKLVNGTISVTDDFKGKISGSTVECPHTYLRANTKTSLQPPSNFTVDITTDNYNTISKYDGGMVNAMESLNGNIPQRLFSFNLIRMVEDKYGEIPSINKVQWLKDNLSSVACKWYGFGNCPSGNLAKLTVWRVDTTTWNGTTQSHTSSSASYLGYGYSVMSYIIDSNGFVHYLVYTDASDGVTTSVVNTDYVSIEVIFKTPTGYDVLIPENTRRDSSFNVLSDDMKNVNDFTGKVNGITLINPHKGYTTLTNALKNPITDITGLFSTGFQEHSSADYILYSKLDNVTKLSTASTNGQIPQHLFSFNLIRMVEDKYGTIPKADKVQWLKDNLSKVICNWYGYGTCPSGNYVTTNWWNVDTSTWTSSGLSNTTSTNVLLSNPTTAISQRIDSSGFVHCLAFTNASDGVTSSNLNTDYVNCEIILKDSALTQLSYLKNKIGKENILLVRKETKEIKTYFPSSNEKGIVSYGEYVPIESFVDSNSYKLIYVPTTGIITTLGSGAYLLPSYNPYANCIRFLPRRTGWDLYKFVGQDVFSTNSNTNGAISSVDIDKRDITYDGSNIIDISPKEGVSVISTTNANDILGNRLGCVEYSKPIGLNIKNSPLVDAILSLPVLALSNGKLVLMIIGSTVGKGYNSTVNLNFVNYNLKNRPLIK